MRDSRVRVRVAISWRARWLCVYAMSGSKAMACRQAHVSEKTADYHIKNDPDFAAVADAAKEHAIDLLHTRAFQRCLGDIEPIYWQGIVVGHVRKFDTRLQIEMLKGRTRRATFKTLGQAPVNVSTGDKILVMDEATRAKLIEKRRQALMAMPGPDERAPESSHSGTNNVQRCTTGGSVGESSNVGQDGGAAKGVDSYAAANRCGR